MQVWFNIKKSINIIHHFNSLNKKKSPHDYINRCREIGQNKQRHPIWKKEKYPVCRGHIIEVENPRDSTLNLLELSN